MMTKIDALGALTLMLAAATATAASDVAFRQEAQNACMGDVLMLCSSAIPDEASIISCMKGRRAQLSAPCREVFDAGVKGRRQQSMR